MPYLIPLGFIVAVWIAIVVLNERWNFLSTDHFPSATVKWIAYLWLGGFLLVLTALITGSSMRQPTPEQLAHAPFYSLFILHAILVAFLLGWWLLTRRPRLTEFFNIQGERPPEWRAG